MHMRKIIGAMAAAMLLATLAIPAMASTEHCPGHQGHDGKVEGENNDLVLDAGTEFCVKAGPYATSVLTADGETSLIEYVEQEGLTVGEGGGGNVPDVSYYIVYANGNGGNEEPNGEEPNGEEPGEEAPQEEAPEEVTEEAPEEVTEEAPEEEGQVLAEEHDAEEAPQEVASQELERTEELAHTGISAWVLALIATGLLAIGGTLVSRGNRA